MTTVRRAGHKREDAGELLACCLCTFQAHCGKEDRNIIELDMKRERFIYREATKAVVTTENATIDINLSDKIGHQFTPHIG